VPRSLVYNKVDLVDASELRLLERDHPNAILVSAKQRETVRPLIDRIARELAEKWEKSAKGPRVSPASSAEDGMDPRIDPPPPTEVEELTTMDEMLRAAGRRVRSRTVA
jgi:hypothetical protein